MSETFSLPEDYSCKACNSKDGKWLHEPNADGWGIICQKCGTTEALFRSWFDEVRSLSERRRKMGSKESRAYCSRGQKWLTKPESNANLLQQCRECDHIRFIGCPGFHHKQEICDPKTRDWIQWWYWDKPIPPESTSKVVNLG